MTKENCYLVSSPPFFLGLLLIAVGRSGNLRGVGKYSNPRSLEGEGFASIPAKIWGMCYCTPTPQVPTVLLLGIFLVWFEKDLKVKFNQICIKRKGNISLIGTKNAS